MLRMIISAGLFAFLFSACIPYSQIRKTNNGYMLVKQDNTLYSCTVISMDGLNCTETGGE